MAEESNKDKKRELIESISKRIELLACADHLSEEQKLLFVQEALKIIQEGES